MTQSKHTPGPWHRNIKANGKYPVVFAGRNQHIAQAIQQKDGNETEANIDLISSAPELLGALEIAEKQLVEYWEVLNKNARLELTGGSVVGSHAEEKANLLWFRIKEIRGTIEKARGVATN
jgi:hypothetical protein